MVHGDTYTRYTTYTRFLLWGVDFILRLRLRGDHLPTACMLYCRDTTEEAKNKEREEQLQEGLSLVRKGVA